MSLPVPPEPLPLQLNLVLLVGRVLRHSGTSKTVDGEKVLKVFTLILENPEALPVTAGGGFRVPGEISVEVWGHLAEEYETRLQAGELVFVEAQVAGRQRQDGTTKRVHHWMVLKAKRIEVLNSPIQHGGM